MFSVQGWSVSSTQLKLQSSHLVKSEVLASSTPPQSGKDSKRKIAKLQSGVIVTGDNLTDLWEKHICKAPGTYVPDTEKGVDNPFVQQSFLAAPKAQDDVNGKGHECQAIAYPKTSTKREGSAKFGNKREKKMRLKSPEATKVPLGSQSSPSHGLGHVDLTEMFKAPILHEALSPSGMSKLTPLQNSMRRKLISARFRHINELLYTTPSSSSAKMFRTNPSFFDEYHEGFQQQVEAWPENPVLAFVSWVLNRSGYTSKPEFGQPRSQRASFKKGTIRSITSSSDVQPSLITCDSKYAANIDPLPRNRRSGFCTIADLGCGSAFFARTLTPKLESLRLKIHSFDLCASNPLITCADISKISLPDSSIDVAISCLALMGTNWLDFVEEAYRLLRWRGEYWIAEVASRFVAKDRATGIGTRHRGKKKGWAARSMGKPDKKQNAEEDKREDGDSLLAEVDGDLYEGQTSKVDARHSLESFITVLRSRGFELAEEAEVRNKMFVQMRFIKGVTPTRGKAAPQLQQPGNQPRRFLETLRSSEQLVSLEDESSVLKPCVYKQR